MIYNKKWLFLFSQPCLKLFTCCRIMQICKAVTNTHTVCSCHIWCMYRNYTEGFCGVFTVITCTCSSMYIWVCWCCPCRYFCELELSETKRALEEKKSYIVKLFPQVPTEKLTFPVGEWHNDTSLCSMFNNLPEIVTICSLTIVKVKTMLKKL